MLQSCIITAVNNLPNCNHPSPGVTQNRNRSKKRAAEVTRELQEGTRQDQGRERAAEVPCQEL